ncbi:MAG: hypothetical protein WBB25_04635 [Sulfitobacter sp.]
MTLALVALAGCGTPDPDKTPAGRSDTRQIPSNYEPGVHITGHANVGVVKQF